MMSNYANDIITCSARLDFKTFHRLCSILHLLSSELQCAAKISYLLFALKKKGLALTSIY